VSIHFTLVDMVGSIERLNPW